MESVQEKLDVGSLQDFNLTFGYGLTKINEDGGGLVCVTLLNHETLATLTAF